MPRGELAGRFHDAVEQQIHRIRSVNQDVIPALADAIAASLRGGGVLHSFGTGHSAGGAMELFHRAGGLVPVNGLLEAELSPFAPPVQAAERERMPGLAAELVRRYDLREAEVLVVFSNSGMNAVPIELAQAAKELDLQVATVTNVAHSMSVTPRHESGLRLMDLGDFVVDTCGVIGDAAVPLADGRACCPTSGIASTLIANWIVAEVVERYVAAGQTPPIYMSANLPGGDEHNRSLEKRYHDRIKKLGQTTP